MPRQGASIRGTRGLGLGGGGGGTLYNILLCVYIYIYMCVYIYVCIDILYFDFLTLYRSLNSSRYQYSYSGIYIIYMIYSFICIYVHT